MREIYTVFAPELEQYFEWVQLVINRIVINELSKHELIDEWKLLIRESVMQYDSITLGTPKLIEIERIDYFYKKYGSEEWKKFFKYLYENTGHLSREFFFIIFI